MEILECRFLLASGTSSSMIQVALPPSQVAAPDSAAPVTLGLPWGNSTLPVVVVSPGDQQLSGVLGSGGGINVYRLDVGPATSSLQLDLTWETLPKGNSASFLVFDAGGNLLIDQTATAGTTSATFSFTAPVPATGSAFYVAVLTSGPFGAVTSGGTAIAPDSTMIPGGESAGSYSLRITSYTPAPPPASVFPANGGANSGTGSVPSSPKGVVVVGSAGSGSSAPGPPCTAQHGESAPGPLPSATTGTGTDPAATPSERIGALSSVRPAASIDFSPLPASQYEPAGGIFADGGSAEGADRVDETRLDIPLVRLLGPVWNGSLDDEWSSEPDTATFSSTGADTSVASRTVLISRKDQASSQVSPLVRSGERIAVSPLGELFALAPLVAADGSVAGTPGLSTATLPLIDESDRPSSPTLAPSPDEDTLDPSSADGRSGRGGAILLGLGSSAVLGVGLYAPDLAAMFRRAFARRLPSPRPRPRSSRDAPGRE
jgi:hypothetical protein